MPNLLKSGDEIVPGYVLVRRLGAGGSGEVWVARVSGGVHVAIKVLRDLALIASDRELEALRIVREAKHPNLCPLFGVWFFDDDHNLLNSEETESILGRDDDLTETICLDPSEQRDSSAEFEPPITETVALTEKTKPAQMIVAMGLGEQTLMDRLIQVRAEKDAAAKEQPDSAVVSADTTEPVGIDPDELMRYMASAASAIDELNERHSIYHCDIKPQNILLVGGQAQVCDFGLARRVEDSRKTSVAFGTPAYGAPEMLFERTYSKTIDQYSLAVTYYELRTGKLPYSSVTQSSLLRAKAMGDVDLSRVPPAERAVLARATDLDPAKRFENCQALVKALDQAVHHPNATEVRQPRKSMRVALPIAAVAVTALLLVVGFWLPTKSQDADLDPSSIVGVAEPETIDSGAPSDDTSANPSEPASSINLDSAVAESSSSETIINDQLLQIRDSDQTIDQRIAGALAVVAAPDARPSALDGKTIEFLISELETATQSLVDSQDQTAIQNIIELCSRLIPIAGQQFAENSPEVARLAFARLSADITGAVADGRNPSHQHVDSVRRLFDDQDRYAYPPVSANAALAVAGSWVAKLQSAGWDQNLADSDVLRAQQLNRGVEANQPALKELLASYLCGLLSARTAAADLEVVNQRTIRVALDLQNDATWGAVAIAAICLADPRGTTQQPSRLEDGGAVPMQLPPELHATYLLGSGWNRWNLKSSRENNKDAVQRWEKAAKVPELQQCTARSDRFSAARHLRDWLLQVANVSDNDSSVLRYAGKAGSADPILATVGQFAEGDADLVYQVNQEQFICSVAGGDFDDAESRWVSVQKLSAADTAMTPQMGRAVFELAINRLDATPGDPAIKWIDLLLQACNIQAAPSLFADADQQPPNAAVTRNDLFRRCFRPTMERIRPQLASPQQIAASGIDEQQLALFCDRFVSLMTEVDRRVEYGAIVSYLSDIETAAAIAGRNATKRIRRSELFFYAADALERSVHEQLDDRPFSQTIEQLKKYRDESKKYGTTVHTDCLDAMVAQEEAYREENPQRSVELNDEAIAKYSRVIHSPAAEAESLLGRAYASRGRVLERRAIMIDGQEKESLLSEALADARRGVEITPDDHPDRESRLENLARVCCEVTQISKTMETPEKLRLIVEATYAISEAIVLRKNLALDDSQLAMAKLFVLGMNTVVSKGSSSSNAAIREARDWLKKTEDLGKQAKSAQIRCAWYYNAAIILDQAGEKKLALERATTAREIAATEIEPGERISHLATLAYVVLKSNQLGDRKSAAEKRQLIDELAEELNGIAKPTPPIANERDEYLKRLAELEQSLR